MSGIDWMGTPLFAFHVRYEHDEDGRLTEEDGRLTEDIEFPHGSGMAQGILTGLLYQVDHIYDELVAPGDYDRLVETGEVPVIRNGKRGYELLEKITLRDLPAVLDTFVVLEEEKEEAERKKAERKERERIRAKERRKLKKLGEWQRIPESNWVDTPHSGDGGGRFAELADAVGFVTVAQYRDYERGEYLQESSPFMIWVLEKVRRP